MRIYGKLSLGSRTLGANNDVIDPFIFNIGILRGLVGNASRASWMEMAMGIHSGWLGGGGASILFRIYEPFQTTAVVVGVGSYSGERTARDSIANTTHTLLSDFVPSVRVYWMPTCHSALCV